MTIKATFSLKAASMSHLTDAIEAIADATDEQIVVDQTVSTSIGLEVRSMKHLQFVLTSVARALSTVSGVEVSVKTPAQAYNGLRLDTTPMEQAIAKVSINGTSVPDKQTIDRFQGRADLRVVRPEQRDADEDEDGE